jgi:hypothetical protein
MAGLLRLGQIGQCIGNIYWSCNRRELDRPSDSTAVKATRYRPRLPSIAYVWWRSTEHDGTAFLANALAERDREFPRRSLDPELHVLTTFLDVWHPRHPLRHPRGYLHSLAWVVIGWISPGVMERGLRCKRGHEGAPMHPGLPSMRDNKGPKRGRVSTQCK